MFGPYGDNDMFGVDSHQAGVSMPDYMKENRMEQYGMPGIFQAAEGNYDEHRRDKWAEQNPGMMELESAMGAPPVGRSMGQKAMSAIGTGIFGNAPQGAGPNQVPVLQDEIQMVQSSAGNPQDAYENRQEQGNTGSGAAMWGNRAGKTAKKLLQAFTGGMM